ncbi:MAG: hypothetical protein OHK0022_10950 [Roseiflexaceae bacterium]
MLTCPLRSPMTDLIPNGLGKVTPWIEAAKPSAEWNSPSYAIGRFPAHKAGNLPMALIGKKLAAAGEHCSASAAGMSGISVRLYYFALSSGRSTRTLIPARRPSWLSSCTRTT